MPKYTKEQLENFTKEELETFTEEQLEVLSIESLKSDLRMRKNEKEEDDRIEHFWKEEYIKMSINEKVKFWSGSLHRSMRDQESNGLNVYAIYTKRWLKDTLIKEPNFIELLPKIYNLWGGTFDSEKVDRIIRQLLHGI